MKGSVYYTDQLCQDGTWCQFVEQVAEEHTKEVISTRNILWICSHPATMTKNIPYNH